MDCISTGSQWPAAYDVRCQMCLDDNDDEDDGDDSAGRVLYIGLRYLHHAPASCKDALSLSLVVAAWLRLVVLVASWQPEMKGSR